MDVKISFLNRVIEEEVFIKQPKGFYLEDMEACMHIASRSLQDQEGTSSMVLKD